MENLINIYNYMKKSDDEENKNLIFYSDLHNPGLFLASQDNPLTNVIKKVVIRDDVIKGGTKGRYSDFVIEEIIKQNDPNELVYLCDVFDSSQIPISMSCNKLKMKLTIFTPTTNQNTNGFSEIAKTYNTNYVYHNTLRECEDELKTHMNMKNRVVRIPNGMNTQSYRNCIKELSSNIRDYFGKFDEVWYCSESSGTLQEIISSDLGSQYCCLLVSPSCVAPIGCKIIEEKLGYEEPSTPYIPNYPCNLFVDSKIYKYVRNNEDNKDKTILIWNKF